MSSDKIKDHIFDEIEKIQNSLREKNVAQRDAIDLQLIGIINMLKKHVLDKQKKLDDFIKRLYELTDDDVAIGLVDTLDSQLGEIGDDYAALLKFEAESKTASIDAKYLEVLLEICSRLGQLILRLQSVEEALDSAVENN